MADETKVANLNVAELEGQIETVRGKIDALTTEIDALREKQKPFVDQRNDLEAQLAAARKVEAMSPRERALLGIPEPQVVAPSGVESAEVVPSPG